MNHQNRAEGIKRARRVLRVWKAYWRPRDGDFYRDDGPLAQRLLKTRQPCSCPGCGNPRRHFGHRTLQERKAELDMIDQLAEVRL